MRPLIAAVLVVLAASARAAGSVPLCYDRRVSPAAAEKGCTDLLARTEAAAPKPNELRWARERRAFTRIALKRYEDAEADLTALLALDPKAFAPLYARGVLKIARGDAAGGRADVDAALAADKYVDERAAESFPVIAGTPAEVAAKCSGVAPMGYTLKMAAECSWAASVATGTDAERAVLLARAGDANLSIGEYGRSRAAYDESLKLDPAQGYVYAGRARLHATAGRADEALADYGRAIDRLPDVGHLRHGRGEIHLNKRDWVQAVADFDKAVELSPDEAWYFADRGRALLGQGSLDAALKDFDAAIKLGDNYNAGRVGRGLVLLNKGDFKGAIATLDEALKEDDHSVSVRWARSLARRKAGDAKGAAADEAQVRKQNKSYPVDFKKEWSYPTAAKK